MKRIGYIVCMALLLHVSCSDRWLEPRPLSVFTPENVYADKAGFEAALISLRKGLKVETHGSINYICAEWSYSDMAFAFTQPNYAEELTPNVSMYYPYLTMFNTAYVNISRANTIISRIDGIDWEQESDRNAVLAEAYFFRSYWYYRLVNAYGDVPFEGKEVSGARLDYYSCSRWTILSEIQSDMEFAVQWLRETVMPGEVSRGAGNHLLAKICLAGTDFDGAIRAADAVINGPYELMKTRFGEDGDNPAYNHIWDLHRVKNKNLPENRETILAVVDRYSDPVGAKDAVGTYSMRLYNPSIWNNSVRDSEGKPGMVASGEAFNMYGRGNNNAKPFPYYTYDIWNYGGYTCRTTPDLRRADANWVDVDEFTYTNPASVDYGKTVNPAWFANPTDTVYCYNAIQLYKFYVPHENDPGTQVMGGNGDWYIYRLAETYLIRAEAYYWKNDIARATQDVNAVRARAQAPPVAESDMNIQFIFDERARELYGETPRHNELVRVSCIMAKLGVDGYSLDRLHESNYFYDRISTNNPYYRNQTVLTLGTCKVSPHNLFWPINATVILANTLGVINQNRGYAGAERNVPPLEVIEE
ncbi:MAG: RagB/SusD family nutrient uptake outer membrane protein [Tannerella sp.]|nr:RagB/SusD family nutrient uptake outer membrane protein [Tannerella sp.]